MNRKLKILFVFDNESDIGIVLNELRRNNINIVYKRVDTLTEFKSSLMNGNSDIVISDFDLQNFAGSEALQILKATKSETPFIFVSDIIGEGIAVQAMKDGADDYLLKDNINRLPAIIERELREAKSRKDNLIYGKALLEYNRIIDIIAKTAKDWVSETPQDIFIKRFIEKLGLVVNASRVNVFKKETGGKKQGTKIYVSRIYEWTAKNIEPQIANLALRSIGFDEMGFGRWIELLSNGKPVVGDISSFPKSERIVLESQKIKSILVIPIHIKDNWWGFIGFDDCVAEREWTKLESDALSIVANILGGYFERMYTSQALTESEERYRTIFENAQIGIYRTTPDGEILEANPALIKILGFSSLEDLKQRNLEKTGYSEDENARKKFKQEIKKQGKVTGFESVWLTKNGGKIYVKENAQAVRDDKGHIKYYEGTVENITDIRNTQQALLKSESEYRKLVNDVNDGFIKTDLRGKVIFANVALANMMGFNSVEEVLGRNIYDYVLPEFRHEVMDDFRRFILNKKEIKRIELNTKRHDGKFAYLEFKPVPVIENKRPVGVQGVIRDNTERRKAEEILREKERLLSQTQRIAGIGSWSIDLETQKIYWTEEVYRIHGVNPETFTLNSESVVNLIHKDDREKVNSWFQKCLRGNIPDPLQARIVLPNRKIRYFNFMAEAVYNKDKKIIKLVGTTQDITERIENERKIIEAKEEAEKSDRLKSEFLAQMSHEIRTPVNVILNIMNLMKEFVDTERHPEAVEDFKIIESSGKRLIQTIDQILSMSELQIGTYTPHFTEIDVYSDVLISVVGGYKREAEAKKIKITLHKFVKDSVINADEHSVNQIFVNLINNAVKYTDKGSVEVIVDRDENKFLIVIVKDTGIGIAKDFLPDLFSKFRQEQQGYSRQYEGNGLGLALVKNYCEINNASIDVESEKGKGTTFKVSFPPQS